MDHDQNICPRCGGPAGDFRFCEPCRAHIDSLRGFPPRDIALDITRTHAALQASGESLRVEQALTAESNGTDDGIAGGAPAAVEVESDPRPATDADASAASIDLTKLPGSAEDRSGGALEPPRGVARLEDVLRVDHRDRIAPRTAAAAAPAVEPAREHVGRSTSDDALERAKRELARLEDALAAAAAKTAAAPVPTVESAPDKAEDAIAELAGPPVVEVEAPAQPQMRVSAPIYLAAHALRASFLYEQTVAFEQAPSMDADEDVVEIAQEAPALAPEPKASIAPPEPAPSEPVVQDDDPPSFLRLWLAQTSRSNWLAAFFLLGLIVAVVVLTGRAPRRLTGGTTD